MAERRARPAGIALALLVGLLVAGYVAEQFHSNTWIFRDGRFYINVNEAIIERGSLDDAYAHSWYDEDLGWNHNMPASFSNIALGRDGTYYSYRPNLLPILATPLYFAFGLIGALLFNTLLFPVIAYFAFDFIRRFTKSDLSAGLAVLVLLFGSGVRLYLYDYSTDILLLSFLAFALSQAWRGHGARVGVAFALTLLIKPTTLLVAPVVAFPFIKTRERRAAIRAVGGVAVVLALGGLMNTYMFGRPWWFGYDRVLTRQNGVATMVPDAVAFTTPLLEGLRDIWEGYWGLRHRWTAYAVAAVGLLALGRRHRTFTLVAGLVATANLVLFAKYDYHDDRFFFPTALVIAPAVSAAFDAVAQAAGLALRRFRLGFRATGPAMLASVFVIWFSLCSIPFREPPEARLGNTPYAVGATAWGQGQFDLAELIPAQQLSSPEGSPITRGRFGHWLPRESPIAVAIAAPFAGVAGAAGIVFLHLLAAGWIAFSLTRILRRAIGPVLATWVSSAIVLLTPMREGLVTGGPLLLATATAAAAIERMMAGRVISAGVLSVVAAWLADAPWLLPVAVLALALKNGRTTSLRCAIAVSATLLLWCLSHLLLIGRPFASPDAFVLFHGPSGFETVAVPPERPWSAFAGWLLRTGPPRALVPAMLAGAAGLLITARQAPGLAMLVVAAAASLVFPTAREHGVLFLLALLAFVLLGPALAAATAPTKRLVHWFSDPKRGVGLAAALLVVLFTAGTVRRAVAAQQPWRIASERAVKDAKVHLGRYPCDFLAWEHMAWECSHYDRRPYAVTGLNVWRGVYVGAKERELFVVSSGSRRLPRRVSWPRLEPNRFLQLRWAIPDGTTGNGIVIVRVNGEEMDRFDVPQSPSGAIELRTIPVTIRSETVELELEVQSRAASPATVAFDGGFVAQR